MFETRTPTSTTTLAPALTEELRPALGAEQAVAEADRCLLCGVEETLAPCVIACPADVDIPAFIEALQVEDPDTAAMTVFAENLLSGTCSRCCPVEVLCEEACVLSHEGRRPVEIGALHRYAADWGLARPKGWRPEVPRRSEHVAVIGAGPAGLACAGELAARGFQVTVHEAREHPGGLVRSAIAPYRQIDEPLPAEAQLIADLGVELRFESPIDGPEAMRELEAKYDAIVLGVGMGPDAEVHYPGAHLDGVWSSLEFIEEVKAGRVTDVGRDVLVIGGGNTAVDAARIARRLGATEVTMVYRRGEAQMPAYAHEIAEARAEGVRFELLTEPVRFMGSAGLNAAELRRTRLQPDPSGRPRPESLEGTEFVMAADTAILAIGQQPRSALLSWIPDLELERGRPVVDPETGRTSNPHYYAGGDAINGGATVVEAVRWGKLIAAAIEATADQAGPANNNAAPPADAEVAER